jgi:hypothetical protein
MSIQIFAAVAAFVYQYAHILLPCLMKKAVKLKSSRHCAKDAVFALHPADQGLLILMDLIMIRSLRKSLQLKIEE